MKSMDAGDMLADDACPDSAIYPATYPATGLRRVLAERQRELFDALNRLGDDFERLDVLERRTVPDQPLPAGAGIELVAAPAEVAARWHELTVHSHGPVRTLHSSRVQRASDRWHPARRLNQLSAGRRFRSVCTRASLEEPAGRAEIEQLCKAGAEFRVLPDVPLELVVADTMAMVNVEPGALVMMSPTMVDGMSHYFELMWTRATPLARPSSTDVEGPTPAQREVLRLAAAGLKDEAIARSLGRSSRWVRRQFEGLEELLSASNRLTLGVAAARRGWV